MRTALNANSPKASVRRRAYVEERVRLVLDEIFVLGAAHVLGEFLGARGNRRASDDDVREICNLIDRGVH